MQGVVPMTLTWASSDFDKRLDLIYLGYIVSNRDEAEQLYGPGAGMLDVYNDMLSDLDLLAIGIIPTDCRSVPSGRPSSADSPVRAGGNGRHPRRPPGLRTHT